MQQKSISTTPSAENPDRNSPAVITSDSVRNPWSSVHAFAITAGRLASGDTMLLICRLDEAAALAAQLRTLLQTPASLQQAQQLLQELTDCTAMRLTELTALETMPLTESSPDALLDELAAMLAAAPVRPNLHTRFDDMIQPNQAGDKITGITRMLNRVQRLNADINRYAHSGFDIEIGPGRRRLISPSDPTRYHLTLCEYSVRRKSARPT